MIECNSSKEHANNTTKEKRKIKMAKTTRRIKGTSIEAVAHNKRESLLITHINGNIEYLNSDGCTNKLRCYTNYIYGLLEAIWYLDIINDEEFDKVINFHSFMDELANNK